MCADHIADTKLNHENSEQWGFFFLKLEKKQQKKKKMVKTWANGVKQ